MSGALAANVDRRRRLAIGAAVAALHVGALLWLGVSVVPVLPEVTTQALDVMLMRPPVAPGDAERLSDGGGAPAAPSLIHRTETPRPEAVELTAPPEPAAIQPLALGVAPLTTPTPGAGQGGVGDGTGDGVGSGAGSGGSGGVTLVQGPAGAIITQDVQSAELVQAGRTHVILRCRILQNQRLAGCRVIGEHPRPSGYRSAALLRSREFRFRQHGFRPRGGRSIVVAIAFPAPEGAETAPPVDGN